MTGPSIGSLFSGYGGIDQGLSRIWPDATVSWVSDIEAGPRKVLAHRYPDAPNLGDITKIDWANVEPVDIITGGSPCQDLSHAGRRMGMRKGTRSGLWASMLEGINTMRPSLVVWENVRGALSAEADSELEPCAGCVGSDDDGPVLRALGRVLGDLANIGYDAAWTGLRAADVGAPHGRFRVFVLAWPADAERERGNEWRLAGSREATSGRASADNRGRTGAPRWNPTDEGCNCHIGGMGRRADCPAHGVNLPTPRATRGGSSTETASMLPTPRATDGTNGGPNQRGSSGDLMLPSAVAQLLPTPQTSDTNGAGEKPGEWGGRWQLRDIILPRIAETFGDYAPAIARWESVLEREAPAPVEPAGRNDANRLSPRFVEFMMGLPDGWIADVPDVTRNEALRLAGNGVVPQQCEAAVRWLLDVRETAARAAA